MFLVPQKRTRRPFRSRVISAASFANNSGKTPRAIVACPRRLATKSLIGVLNLHCGLGEVDVAAVAQFKAHHVLHDPVKPLPVLRRNVSPSEVIREVAEGWQC